MDPAYPLPFEATEGTMKKVAYAAITIAVFGFIAVLLVIPKGPASDETITASIQPN